MTQKATVMNYKFLSILILLSIPVALLSGNPKNTQETHGIVVLSIFALKPEMGYLETSMEATVPLTLRQVSALKASIDTLSAFAPKAPLRYHWKMITNTCTHEVEHAATHANVGFFKHDLLKHLNTHVFNQWPEIKTLPMHIQVCDYDTPKITDSQEWRTILVQHFPQ